MTMSTLDIIEKVMALLVTVTTGGVLGWIFKARFITAHEKVQLKSENEESKSAELRNAESIISLYKTALEDSIAQGQKQKEQYELQLNQLEDKVNRVEKEARQYADQVKSQAQTIDMLTKNQIKMKLEIMTVRSQSISDCDSCEFKLTCDKFKAKKLSYEQIKD